MMVGVEEGQRLLPEDKEDGIDEFKVFGNIVELDQISKVDDTLLSGREGHT